MANPGYERAVDYRQSRVEMLYAAHIQQATRLAYLMTGEREVAEDLAQDAFVKVVGRFKHLRSDQAFGGYLMTSVVNACRAHWRRRKVERFYLERFRGQLPTTEPGPDVGGRLAIAQALESLPPRQRTAVVLRHYVDLSEQRTADVMGCSVGTIKTLTSRGLRTLRERMDR